MSIFETHRVQDLQIIMPEVLAALAGTKKILLEGEMGAGKTTFVQYFCSMLGVKDYVSSPTFSLVNVYELPADQQEKWQAQVIRHLDLYRLKSTEEALDIGIADFLDDENWCFIEWADPIKTILPQQYAKIYFQVLSKNKRKLQVEVFY